LNPGLFYRSEAEINYAVAAGLQNIAEKLQ